MTTSAIRFLATTKPSPTTSLLHLTCHIKPSVSAIRSGIQSVTDTVININVSAQPRNGESDKAVRKLIAEALAVPKVDVEIIRGLKSREKVIAVRGFRLGGDKVKGEDEDGVELVRRKLLRETNEANHK